MKINTITKKHEFPLATQKISQFEKNNPGIEVTTRQVYIQLADKNLTKSVGSKSTY